MIEQFRSVFKTSLGASCLEKQCEQLALSISEVGSILILTANVATCAYLGTWSNTFKGLQELQQILKNCVSKFWQAGSPLQQN